MTTIYPGDTVYLRDATDVSFIVEEVDLVKLIASVRDRNDVIHYIPLAMLTKFRQV